MSYPFSIIGTFIFLIYAAAVFAIVVMPLWKWLLKDKVWKFWVITPITVSLLVIPIAEELWIQHRFETLCKDAGIHVKRKVKVDGYFDATKSDLSIVDKMYSDPKAVDRLRKSGFRFIERRTNHNKVRHLEVESGKIKQMILDKPESQYHVLHTRNHSSVGHQLTKMQWVIIDSQLNEMISRDTRYARYPGFIEGLWIRFLGDGQVFCRGVNPGKSKLRSSLESYTFIPMFRD